MSSILAFKLSITANFNNVALFYRRLYNLGAPAASIPYMALFNRSLHSSIYLGAPAASIPYRALFNRSLHRSIYLGAPAASIPYRALFNRSLHRSIYLGAPAASIPYRALFNRSLRSSILNWYTRCQPILRILPQYELQIRTLPPVFFSRACSQNNHICHLNILLILLQLTIA